MFIIRAAGGEGAGKMRKGTGRWLYRLSFGLSWLRRKYGLNSEYVYMCEVFLYTVYIYIYIFLFETQTVTEERIVYLKKKNVFSCPLQYWTAHYWKMWGGEKGELIESS